jgi:transposase InsO family protein
VAGVKDVYTKELVGYCLSSRMTADIVVQALTMAIKRRKPMKGLIVHSDRGSQYCSHIYRDLIAQHQFVGSMAEQAYEPVNTSIGLYKHEKIETPRTTYYGIVKLSDLVALHEAKGKALYERNIRYFLGSAKSGVNKAIKSTLNNNPADFFFLNNGVTAVCDVIDPKGVRGGVKTLKIRGFSIINGAQTVASAAEFVSQFPAKDISDAKVMLTLINADTNGEFGKRVTKARNHQNPVQAANFASLDENQERLRQEIKHLEYDYHYRPEAVVAAGANVITLEEALRALAFLQNDSRYPAWLKNEFVRLTNPDSAEYQTLFSGHLTGATLINAVLCYREVRRLMLYNEHHATGQERLIYRHGAHVISAVMIKRLRGRINAPTTINPTTIPTLISLGLDQLRQDTFDLAGQHLRFVGPLAYFRNQGNVTTFLVDLMEKNYALATDPAIAPLRNLQGVAEAYPKKRLIDYLASRAPQL